MANSDLTISLPEDLIRRARVYAASHGVSVSELISRLLAETVGEPSSAYVHKPVAMGAAVDVADVGAVLDRLDDTIVEPPQSSQA